MGNTHAGMGSRRSISIERRLPLLITALLAVTLASSLALVYLAVRESVEVMAHDQLRSATRVLADALESGVAQTRARWIRSANAAAVRGLLARTEAELAVDTAAAREALAPFVPQGDSLTSVELWTRDGRRVASLGPDVRPRTSDGDPRLLDLLRDEDGMGAADAADSLVFGDLFVENGRVHYWVVVPVHGQGAPEGYVATRRRLNGSASTEERLRGLVGDAVNGYLRVPQGGVWATLQGEPVSSPTMAGLLVATDTVGGTPFLLELHQPRRVVLAPVRATFGRLSALGVLVLAFGAIGAWLIGRRITRPLSSLTSAAEAMAQGDYGSRVEVDGHEEIARLAASFNRMVATVDASRAELEAQVAAARAMAGELASANHRLQETNVRLQSAMGEAGRARAEAEEARRHAEGANRAKSEFLAVMSHELRTPLNAIGGYAELMAMEIRGPITESQRRDLERIRASQEHLLGLISAILDLSRIESGRLQYQLAPIVLAPFLAGLDALVEPQAAAKSLHLAPIECPPDLAVLADREKLRQVLLNLLSNAIRYTPPGGRITLAASARADGMVAMSITDTGVGIAPEALGRIFEPFVQLDRSLTQVREGVGLGLAISRDLARAMGGDLSVESIVDEGSTFTLTLPSAAAEGAPAYLPTGEHAAAVRE